MVETRPVIAPTATVRRLTARERQIIAILAGGVANKDIAHACGISEKTVKHHLTNIFNKLGVSNRLALALLAIEHGIVDVERV